MVDVLYKLCSPKNYCVGGARRGGLTDNEDTISTRQNVYADGSTVGFRAVRMSAGCKKNGGGEDSAAKPPLNTA